MTLPKEIQKRIDSDANDYLGTKEVEFSQRSFNAYLAGATEWAGRAQSLTDAVQGFIDEVDTEGLTEDRLNELIAAIAKYKEVSNG
jgi:hypothetical protein